MYSVRHVPEFQVPDFRALVHLAPRPSHSWVATALWRWYSGAVYTTKDADQQIFFDPERKRWKRLRRILDAIAVLSTLVVAGFIFNVLRNQQLPELLLPNPKHNYR